MNFSQVTDITIPEGDVVKIMEGSTVLWEKSGWPAGYVKVEYLEGTGTQYIDTGVAPSNKTRLKAHFYAGNLGLNIFAVLGSRESGTYNNSYAVFYVGSNSVSVGCMRADFNRITAQSNIYKFPNTSDKTEYELDYNGNVVTLNNDSHTFTDQTFTSTRNIYLFTVNNGDAPDPRIMLGKFYYCQISDDGTLVADLQPCVRLSDGKPGMYDLVRRQFFTNAGTGEFLIGPTVQIPDAYQPVQYIESTGTQYIDTGVAGSNLVTSKTIFEFTSSNVGGILAGVPYNYATSRCYQCRTQSTGYYQLGYGSAVVTSTIQTLVGTKYEYETKIENGNYNTYSNSTLAATTPANQTFSTSPRSLYLFAVNNDGTAQNLAFAKVYSCQISDNGALVRYFVPCYRKSDNVAGMYDIVNDVFYTNSGTGTFTVGPSLLPNGYMRVGWLESDGNQWIQASLDSMPQVVHAKGSFEYTELVNAWQDVYGFGRSHALGTNTDKIMYLLNSSSSYGNVNFAGTASNTKYEFESIQNGGALSLTLNGTTKTGTTTSTVYQDETLFLFALRENTYLSEMRLYDFKFYTSADDSQLVFDLVPALRFSDGKPGMYDLVRRQFLTNRGTGDFTAGPGVT